jgi:hypothetical protein
MRSPVSLLSGKSCGTGAGKSVCKLSAAFLCEGPQGKGKKLAVRINQAFPD